MKVNIKNELVPLTSLRGVAAIWVALLHFKLVSRSYIVNFGCFSILIDEGYLAVDFFFILSGFILSYVYIESLSKFNIKNTLNFLILRFARIYPLHLFVLLAFAITIYFFKIQLPGTYTFKSFLLHLFNLQGLDFFFPGFSQTWNCPAWTISTEWLMYTLFPVFALVISKVKSVKFNLFSILILLVLMFNFCRTNNFSSLNIFLNGITVRTLWGFLSGMFLFNIYKVTRNNNINVEIIFCILFLFFLIISLTKNHLLIDLVAVILMKIFILTVAKEDNFVSVILSLPILKWIGEISYSIYMIHFMLIFIIDKFKSTLVFLSSYIIVGIYLICLLFFSYILYNIIELPARRLIRNIVLKKN